MSSLFCKGTELTLQQIKIWDLVNILWMRRLHGQSIKMLKGTAALPSSLRGAVHQIGVLSSKVTHLQRSRRAALCLCCRHTRWPRRALEALTSTKGHRLFIFEPFTGWSLEFSSKLKAVLFVWTDSRWRNLSPGDVASHSPGHPH